MRAATAFALSLLFALTDASASEGEGPFSLRIKSRGFDERCVRLEAGEAIRYRFTASVPVDFNIHHHRGKDVFYPVKSSRVDSGDASFVAPGSDDYCLMWEHAGPGEAAVTGTLERLRRR
jgi:hypothetical protein